MSRTIAVAAAFLLSFPAGAGSEPAEPGPAGGTGRQIDTLPGIHRLQDSRQHVVSVVEGPSTVAGVLYRFEMVDGDWRRVGPPVPMVVGRSGVGPKEEGDGRSPRGIFPLGPAFGYASSPPAGLRWSYRAMEPGTVCVDDPASDHYARIVPPPGQGEEPDWESAEAMRRDLAHGDDLYEWGIDVEYNPDGTPGAGSCIFLHVWRGPESPTAGCTAMPEERLLELMSWLRPEERPVLIQGTRAEVEELHASGVLPYPIPVPGEG